MPLYTYIVAFKGQTYAAQSSHSNFRGFVTSWASLSQGALPALTPSLQKELARKAYNDEFYPIENRKHVWRKTIDLGGSDFVVYAIQTEP